VVANEIGSGDVAPDSARRIQPNTLAPKAPGRAHDLGWHDAVFDDLLIVVDVVNEQIERLNPLFEATFYRVPLCGRDDAGHEVERKDAFGAGTVAVHVECDPHVQECTLGRLLSPEELAVGERVDELDERSCRGTRSAVGLEQLVEETAGVVLGEPHRLRQSDGASDSSTTGQAGHL